MRCERSTGCSIQPALVVSGEAGPTRRAIADRFRRDRAGDDGLGLQVPEVGGAGGVRLRRLLVDVGQRDRRDQDHRRHQRGRAVRARPDVGHGQFTGDAGEPCRDAPQATGEPIGQQRRDQRARERSRQRVPPPVAAAFVGDMKSVTTPQESAPVAQTPARPSRTGPTAPGSASTSPSASPSRARPALRAASCDADANHEQRRQLCPRPAAGRPGGARGRPGPRRRPGRARTALAPAPDRPGRPPPRRRSRDAWSGPRRAGGPASAWRRSCAAGRVRGGAARSSGR